MKLDQQQEKILADLLQQQGAGVFTHCPRCGELLAKGTRAKELCLSRRADVYVCQACGTIEAVEDAGIIQKVNIENWWIFRDRRESKDGY